jgi:hypothetical protein
MSRVCLDTVSAVQNALIFHSVVTIYSGRNYLFEVSVDMAELFDAARVGNVTRFLNHDADANCEARGKS